MPNKYYQEGVLAGMLAGGVQANVTNIGYQVTFKVNGDTVYIASCEQGESISRPPDNYIWLLNGNSVSFPYTPSSDVELIGSTLPAGYTMLNYLETTGTQYLDTGVSPATYNGFGLKIYSFAFMNDLQKNGSSQFGNCFFGSTDSASYGTQSMGFSLDHRSSDYAGIWALNTSARIPELLIFEKDYDLESGFSQRMTPTAYLKIDNDLKASFTQSSWSGSSHSLEISSMCGWDSTYGYGFMTSMRFGQIIVTTPPTIENSLEGTTELRHFYPCLDDNNTPCMYDTITQTTFYNAGSGTFLYG